MAEELEQDFVPTAEELEAAVNPPAEPLMGMGDETPPDKHAIELDGDKIKFTANGGEVEATREEMIKYAQQGYGAANKIGELNRQLEELQAKQAPEGIEEYQQIDTWAKENPEKWAAIQAGYQEHTAPEAQVPPEMQEALAPLMQELQGLREFQQTIESERAQSKLQAEDSALDTEIKSIRESYPDLDFDAPGEDGNSLEWQVMKHAADNGITSFKTAFRDFNHEKLIKLAEEKGKEQVIQERRARNKMGLLSMEAPTVVESNPDYNPRNASDLENYHAALAELKQG